MFSFRPTPLHYCFAALLLLTLALGKLPFSQAPHTLDSTPVALAFDAGTDPLSADDLLTEAPSLACTHIIRISRQAEDSAAPPNRAAPPDHPPPEAA